MASVEWRGRREDVARAMRSAWEVVEGVEGTREGTRRAEWKERRRDVRGGISWDTVVLSDNRCLWLLLRKWKKNGGARYCLSNWRERGMASLSRVRGIIKENRVMTYLSPP